MSEPEPRERLDEDELRAGLRGCRIGNRITVVDETSSTNDLAWQLAGPTHGEGLVIFAERQTAGRGQYGRRWHSAPYKGLWFSVLLRPGISLNESPRLTALLAEVVAATIREQTNCVPMVKPPNDIYIANRKVAGVLVEGRMASDGQYSAVAGVGVNVNQSLEDFPGELRTTAGSLAIATGGQIHRSQFAVALLRKLNERYEDFTRM